MANIPELVDWTLGNSSKISLKVTKLKWISEWLPGHFDYQVSISHGGEIFRGRGIDEKESIAFCKSVAEAFERLAMNGFENPWGTAAYPDYTGAAERAYHELLGIDRALCHHYCKERFRELDLAVLPDKFDRKAIQKALSKHDIEIKLFELRPARDARVCTMMAWSKRPRGAGEGFVNGYGCASDIRAAAGGAAYECLRTAAAVYVGGARPEQPFESLKRPGSSWYHFWAVQTKECQDYFHENLAPLPGVSDRVAPEALESGDVPIERIDRLNSLFPDIPLVIAQAKPGKLIKPQFGVFYHDEAFVARLRGFCGRPVHPDFSVPHFYG